MIGLSSDRRSQQRFTCRWREGPTDVSVGLEVTGLGQMALEGGKGQCPMASGGRHGGRRETEGHFGAVVRVQVGLQGGDKKGTRK